MVKIVIDVPSLYVRVYHIKNQEEKDITSSLTVCEGVSKWKGKKKIS